VNAVINHSKFLTPFLLEDCWFILEDK
jgi:hypothetical protein